MVVAVVSEQRLPIEHVWSWHWSRLRDAYAEVARSRHEQQTATISAATIGTARAIMATIHGKPAEPLPDFETVYHDPFAPAVHRAPGFLDQIVRANTPAEDAP